MRTEGNAIVGGIVASVLSAPLWWLIWKAGAALVAVIA